MKVLLLAFLIAASPIAAASASGKSCAKFSPTDVVSPPLTIDEIERQEMAELSAWLKVRPDIPKVPFGFANADWVAFKTMFQRGDKIVRYSKDRHSWQHLAGRTGIALVRSGCVVQTFTTMMN